MKVKRSLLSVLIAVLLVFGMAGGAMAAWGTKELETEKIAVTFAAEVQQRGLQGRRHGGTEGLDRPEETDAHRGHHAL